MPKNRATLASAALQHFSGHPMAVWPPAASRKATFPAKKQPDFAQLVGIQNIQQATSNLIKIFGG